jgi:hypothetical protein
MMYLLLLLLLLLLQVSYLVDNAVYVQFLIEFGTFERKISLSLTDAATMIYSNLKMSQSYPALTISPRSTHVPT